MRSVADAAGQPLTGDPVARVLVAGASGLAGALSAELVWRHPSLELASVTSRSDAGVRLDELHPRRRVPMQLTELDLDLIEGVDAAIVAYPHGASAPTVAQLRGLGIQVCDLSADFRLGEIATYEEWYGPHGAPELLEDAVYGLPELERSSIADAGLVANPGCYPTASVLALAPLAEQDLLVDVTIDAKSGASGAGRGSDESLSFVNVDENLRPYATDGHRHLPEIAERLGAIGASDASVSFVPHLAPLDQGELVSCYVELREPREVADLRALYEARYADEPFVELVNAPPGVRDVRDTNVCRVYVEALRSAGPGADDRGRVAVFAAIDNLWKGAASQAVQNLNLMLGLPEAEGIS